MTLSLVNLTKRYGAQAVVDEVTFDAPTDGLTGVIGPNGAGKSTLFSLISGFIAADDGRVFFQDIALDRLTAPQRATRGLVRTFQTPKEYAHLTVRDNLMAAAPDQSGEWLATLFLRPGRVAREERALREKVDGTLALLRLDGVADQRASGLSGGQKKLLELGRALISGARLILLDEPFAGVNPVLIERIVDLIRELNRQGVGFLIIEHDLGALSRLVARMHVMDRGRVIASGAPREVLADPVVRDAYLGGASA